MVSHTNKDASYKHEPKISPVVSPMKKGIWELFVRSRHKSTSKRRFQLCSRSLCTAENERIQIIKKQTKQTSDHMTPEITLHLITKDCPLWDAKVDDVPPFPDPFWAFYWPGGKVLTRFILDNGHLFRGQTVLDVGSGCGASAIAAAMMGADNVIANDIDPFAASAIMLNATENGVNVQTERRNLIGQLNSEWSSILLGDMFYDLDFRDSLVDWLTVHIRKFKTNVFIGDPGRLPLIEDPIRNHLTKVAEYELPAKCVEENCGLTTGYVWKLTKT